MRITVRNDAALPLKQRYESLFASVDKILAEKGVREARLVMGQHGSLIVRASTSRGCHPPDLGLFRSGDKVYDISEDLSLGEDQVRVIFKDSGGDENGNNQK